MKRKSISTDLQLSKLKPEDKPYNVQIANVKGLYVTVGTKTKTFKWTRPYGFSPRKVTYCHYPAMSIKKAREAHEKAQLEHQQGTYGMVADKPKTVSELAEMFYKERIEPKRKRPDAVRQVLDHDVIPAIGSKKLEAVNTPTVRNVVKIVVDREKTTHAGKVLAILKQMFRFAVSNAFMANNPAESLEPDALGVVNNVRSRVLSDSEIKIFWNALNQNKSPVTRVALQLLLLLGVRSGELRLAKWEDVDFNNKTLTIPVENQKLNPKQAQSAKPFVVPLSNFALQLLQSLSRINDFVFPGAKDNQPLSDKVFGRAVRRMLENLEVEKFTPHDLRRTLRTRLGEMKIPPHIAEKCLNHSLGRIVNTYDQHDYLDERRAALLKWSDYVEQLTGSNVVQLRKSA